jgi:hypothetical protein
VSEEAVRAIGAFCTDHGIDAHYRYDGWLWAATSAAQDGAWDSTIAELERAGAAPFVRLESEEVARRAGPRRTSPASSSRRPRPCSQRSSPAGCGASRASAACASSSARP